jgi:hypothetical protein
VIVGVGVLVGVSVIVAVGVFVGVSVIVGVGVFVGVSVIVGVGVFVGVSVTVGVGVKVGVVVGVGVGVGLGKIIKHSSIVNSSQPFESIIVIITAGAKSKIDGVGKLIISGKISGGVKVPTKIVLLPYTSDTNTCAGNPPVKLVI